MAHLQARPARRVALYEVKLVFFESESKDVGWQVHPDADTLQVRAGEGQSEADNYVLTNTVYKTSMSSGLSSKGKSQVRYSSVVMLLRAGDSLNANAARYHVLTLPACRMP